MEKNGEKLVTLKKPETKATILAQNFFFIPFLNVFKEVDIINFIFQMNLLSLKRMIFVHSLAISTCLSRGSSNKISSSFTYSSRV